MLKHNSKGWSRFFGSASFLIFIFFFFGCKTVPAGNPVDALDLLDNKSSFYLAIPASVDPQLISNILINNIENISEQDADAVAKRVDVIYCGLNKHRNTTELQSAIKADIPQSFIPKIFSKKNGWNSSFYTAGNSEKKYPVYENPDIKISVPGSDIICIGRDMEYMLNQYHEISEDLEIKQNYSELPEAMYNYLKGAETEIRFYANKPQSFLTILTGANLDLKLIDVYGSFVCDPKYSNQYILELNFRFRNDKYLKAGRTLLSMAFGLANGESETDSNNELTIKNIKLKKEQLMKILVLKKL